MVDDVSCPDHDQVRQDACEDPEEGQGKGPRPDGRGGEVVSRQCPRTAYRDDDAAAGIGRSTPRLPQRVWAAQGGQCGKYPATSLALQLDGLQRHDELVFGRDRCGPAVRDEPLAMSAATIDRHLAPMKARNQISGVSADEILTTAVEFDSRP
jgi:hypothetical protein